MCNGFVKPSKKVEIKLANEKKERIKHTDASIRPLFSFGEMFIRTFKIFDSSNVVFSNLTVFTPISPNFGSNGADNRYFLDKVFAGFKI